MTWLSTWPTRGPNGYAENATEAAAEAHATAIVRRGEAAVATIYELVLPDEEIPA